MFIFCVHQIASVCVSQMHTLAVVDPGFTKGGGHKIMDACCLYDHTFIYLPKPQDGRWSKLVLLQKDLFFGFHVISPIFRAFPVQFLGKHTFHILHFFGHKLSLFHFFSLRPHPPLIQRGGAHSTCIFIFLLGHAHIWPKRGGGGHVPEMPP